MATIQDFVDEVRPFVTGCSDIEIAHNVLHMLSDFCKKTWCWTTDAMDDIEVEPDEESYEVLAPSGTKVVAVIRAQMNGSEFEEYTFAPPYLTLYTIPSEAFVIDHIRIAVRPTLEAKHIPDFIFEEHGDTITQGAKGRLMAMPGRKWFSPELATAFLGIYGEAKSKAAKVHRTALQPRPRRSSSAKGWF